MAENEKKDDSQSNGQTTNGMNGNTQGDKEKNDDPHTKSKVADETNGDGEGNNVKESKPENPAMAKVAAAKDKLTEKKEKARDKANPPGGKDDTPIPSAPDGYTVRFTIHRAENMPISDLQDASTDPYVHATLTSPSIQKRHKEDPDMVLRTKTIHKSTNPVWNQEWVVANIPSGGFRLKCRIYDEDQADHDDRLGNVTISANNIGTSWHGIREQGYDVKKRMGSKRAYLLKGCISMLSRNTHMTGKLYLSVEVIGKSEPPHGRMYTLGPCMWTKHFSPMIGRIAGTKNPNQAGGESGQGKTERYDFQANQFQFQGPVPPTLYHRFVEFKPFVKGMFVKTGFRGRILNNVLHKQHRQVYNYDRATEYGIVEPKSQETSKQFLEMVHYDEGGRIFTYILSLDGLMRFTETGKEFGIDLLSKHTMHSDVSLYIACSGEFFVRRLAKPKKSVDAPDQKTHPGDDLPGGPPNEKPPQDPENYELVIDNDSGTYRPDGNLLGDLKKFLNANLPGVHILTKKCTDDELSKMKDEQREVKTKQGQNVDLVQNSDGEISSSDEEALNKHSRALKGERQHRSAKQKAYKALEDPAKVLKETIPGGKGRLEREQRETNDDLAGEGSSS